MTDPNAPQPAESERPEVPVATPAGSPGRGPLRGFLAVLEVALALVVAVLLSGIAVGGLRRNFDLPLDLPIEETTSVSFFVALFAVQAVIIGGIGWILMRRRSPRVEPADRTPIGRAAIVGLLAAIASMPVTLVINLSMSALGFEVREQAWVVSLAKEDPSGLLLLAPWIVLIAPITEEVFFRGYAFPYLLRRAGAVTGYLVSTVLFALMHLHPPMIPVYLFYGLLLAYLYSRTSTLVTPLVAHCAINTVALLLLLLTGGNL